MRLHPLLACDHSQPSPLHRLSPPQDIDKSDEGLAAAFKKVDTSGDGKISSEEMRAYITKVFGKDLDEKTFDAMMKVADVDGDGEVDLDEFKAIMRAGPESK